MPLILPLLVAAALLGAAFYWRADDDDDDDDRVTVPPVPPPSDAISRNVNLADLLVSANHPEIASKMTLTPAQLDQAVVLANGPLDWIIDRYPAARITSGFRSPELNAAIPGSASTSQHLFPGPSESNGPAAAADVWLGGDASVLDALRRMLEDPSLTWDQAIAYPGSEGHLHVSIRSDGTNRRAALVKIDEKTTQVADAKGLDAWIASGFVT